MNKNSMFVAKLADLSKGKKINPSDKTLKTAGKLVGLFEILNSLNWDDVNDLADIVKDTLDLTKKENPEGVVIIRQESTTTGTVTRITLTPEKLAVILSMLPKVEESKPIKLVNDQEESI